MRTRKRTGIADKMREERQEAAHALLSRPWLTKQAEPEMFQLVKDHHEALRNWFFEHAGYALLVTRTFAKLEKIPGTLQPWMAVDSFRGPRDYALFTYGLWFLEGQGDGDQFLLSELVEAIRDHLLGAGENLDWTLYDHRLSMVRALKKLRELGVLTAVEGEESDWAREGGDTNVLYEASPLARYVLRRFPRELMSYQDVDELIEVHAEVFPQYAEDGGNSQSGGTLARRHKVFRRLLLEPVVYDWEWTDDERRYVQTQRSWLISQMENTFGFSGRRFREGLYFSWPELMGEMDLFPGLSAMSDLALLLSATLRNRLETNPLAFEQDANGCFLLTRGEFEGLLLQMRQQYEPLWTKDHREKSTAQLADELIHHLSEWKLAGADGDHQVRLYPGLSRWSGFYPEVDTQETESEGVVG